MLTWRENGDKSLNLDSDFSGTLAHINVWRNPGEHEGWWAVRYSWDAQNFIPPIVSIEKVKRDTLIHIREHLMAFIAEIEDAL
jgi:hypothetical protein